MTQRLGTLYGIGVGPGDPDLITLKALKILIRRPHIFAATSSKNTYSLAEDIIRAHVQDGKVEHLPFPMTRNREVLQKAWLENAQRVLAILRRGEDAAFITLGDPMIYSTFGYLLATIRRLEPDVRVVIIPGVTSYHAAAALTETPLAEGEETITVVSGAQGGARLRQVLDQTDNLVLLKTYRHLDDILNVLEEQDLMEKAVCVSHVGLAGEKVIRDLRSLKGQKLPYLSMLIIKKGAKQSASE